MTPKSVTRSGTCSCGETISATVELHLGLTRAKAIAMAHRQHIEAFAAHECGRAK